MTTSISRSDNSKRQQSGDRGSICSILLSPWCLPVVITLAFAVRLCWILVFDPKPVSDFSFYFQCAESIARGFGYTKHGGFATAYFPVGYPLFLGMLFRLFGISIVIAQTANLIFSVVSLVLVYWIARELFQSELTGRLALFFLAIYPNNIAYTPLLGVEVFHLFLLLLGVAILLPSISNTEKARFGRLLIAGLVFGLATLVKMQTLLLPALLLLLFPQFSWEKRRLNNRLKKIGILYAVIIVVLSPWIVRNYLLYDDLVLSNNDGLNLYMGNGPEANGTWVAVPWFPADNNTQDEYKLNQTARRDAIGYVRTHPLRTLTLLPKKLFSLLSHGDGVYWNIISTRSALNGARGILLDLDLINTMYEIVLLILFIASLFFGLRTRLKLGKGRGWPMLGLLVIVYFIGIYLVYYGAARYHFPIVPWAIMYSAAIVAALIEKVSPETVV
jgi:4-amino-4-deoxy-L-arabinose transferase-like glycosyltransferase